ncbi:MAG TPA: AAA family ATPase, partial [Sporichthya sp.]|nr:AAA family ATPase [Sporichthya sp.]
MSSDGAWLGPETAAERVFDAYVPRLVLHHLAREPFHPVRTVAGTMLFADLSGFTKLSEKLQRRGPEGAELLVTTINGVFEALLRLAYDNGGSLIKFGGDALLIFYEGEGHAQRATHAAFRMRERLRTVGRLEVSGVRGVLRMTVGLHSDQFHFVLAGESHLEHLVLGAGARGIVETEALAQNGQIVVSATTAAALPARCCAEPDVHGARLLRRSPLVEDATWAQPIPRPPVELVGRALSTAVRAHVLGGRPVPEHRRASVAFLQFGGTHAIIADEGIDAAAAAVHELVTDVQAAADAWEVCFLDSDIDSDGGKLLLTAGAPRVVGDDEERMLLTLRQVLDRQSNRGGGRLPIRIGVNRGPVFTGEIGPYYRRSYTVMGDTTNLAARVMGKSRVGALWATAGILDRSTTKFATVTLEPFAAKGKAKLVQAYEVGEARRSATVTRGARALLPLVGRDAEAQLLRDALAGLAAGRGRAVALTGDAGTGKSRLVDELSALPGEVFRAAAGCEAHTAATPYGPWQSLLPALAGLPADAGPDAAYAAALRRCTDSAPDLLPWAPLIAEVLGAAAEPTEQVVALAPEYRAGRLHEVVLRFLKTELARPTVLAVENAHHLDEASRALVDALVARLDEAPWLVVTVGRDLPDSASERIELAPLDPTTARELAEVATEEHPLPPHVLAEAVARSGGNPQFLLDLLDAAGGGLADLPDSAQAASMAVIDALPPSDRALVRRLSVFGSSFDPAQLAAVGLTPPEDGPEGWQPVWRRLSAILESSPGGRMSFRRTAVQEAAYAGLPFGDRRRLHADLAAALAAEDAPDPAVLARHHFSAGQQAAALPYALAAAERSLASGAPADAARLFRSALQAALETGRRGPELAGIFDGLGLALRRSG